MPVIDIIDNNGCVSSYFQRTVNIYCKYTLLYRQHIIDYSKIYPRFISIVLSLEKIY